MAKTNVFALARVPRESDRSARGQLGLARSGEQTVPDVGAIPSMRKRATADCTHTDLLMATCPPPLRISSGAPSCAANPRDHTIGVVGSKVLAMTSVDAKPARIGVSTAVDAGHDTHVVAIPSLNRIPEKRGATPYTLSTTT